MATPGQLVKTMAKALGIPAETVTNYDRVLSENGMRSKSGRGRGAAKVTAIDAANLLIAILGSPVAGASVKEAANTCRTYGSLRENYRTGFEKLGLPMFDELPNKHTLRDGLSKLIDSAAKLGDLRIPTILADGLFFIRLTGPEPWAEIAIDDSVASVMMGQRKLVAQRVYTQQRKSRRHTDLHQTRIVSYRTIRKLGSLLGKGSD